VSKKRRRGGVPRMSVKPQLQIKSSKPRRCATCPKGYKGIIRDAKTNKIERELSCEDNCVYFARII